MSDSIATILADALQREQSGEREQAIAILTDAIDSGHTDVLLHSNRGLMLDRTGNHTEALSAFRKAYVIEPNFRDHYNAGNMLLHLKRFEDAISEFQASLSYREDYPDCWTNLGIAQHATAQIDNAQKSFDRALAIDPDFIPAYRCLAILYSQTENLPLANAHFKRVAEASPESYAAWFEYACSLYKSLDETAVSFDPSGPEGLAVSALDKAIEINPDAAGAWGRKIGVQFRLADAAQATDNANPDPNLPRLLPFVLADLATTIAAARERFPEDSWFGDREKDLEGYQGKNDS